jgi:hypothetical protein
MIYNVLQRIQPCTSLHNPTWFVSIIICVGLCRVETPSYIQTYVDYQTDTAFCVGLTPKRETLGEKLIKFGFQNPTTNKRKYNLWYNGEVVKRTVTQKP